MREIIMKAMDGNGIDHTNTYLTITTIVLTALSKLTLSDGAAIGAMLAAASTILVNVAKYQETKRNRKK